jgi:hypothetical protein
MNTKKPNLPKKDAGRNLAKRLKELGNKSPPESLANKIKLYIKTNAYR